MVAGPGPRQNSWTPRGGMRGDVGNSIGLHRKSLGSTRCSPALRDAGGLVQPDKHDQNYGGYVINHSLPIEVFVDHSRGARP